MINHFNYNDLTDVELVNRLQNHDHSAYTEIYNRYYSLLYLHAVNKLQNEDDANDAIQELFLKIWRKSEQIVIENNLVGYLFVALRNVILNMIRHKNIIETYAQNFDKANLDSGIYTDTLVRKNQFEAMIESEIANMPPRMRTVFELRRKENMSNKQVAEHLGITESTAADQMKKALRILRSKFGLILFTLYYLSSK